MPSRVSKSRFWFAVRNSIAKWMFLPSARPGTGKSRGMVEPMVKIKASWFARSTLTSTLTPTWADVTNSMPSSASKSTRRCTFSFASFMLGMPYMRRPPTRSSRSYTVTLWPSWFRQSAAASPAGPDPTTATRMPERVLGMRGVIQPSSKPRSTIEYSIFLIVTGESTSPATHAPSHGAGHTRPVNSGKLFVCDNRSSACFHWSWYTNELNSGIKLLIGQPVCVWQNGTPQSMHLAACTVLSTGPWPSSLISPQSVTRSIGSL
mmetsp:Transcript_12789/g.38588  ORF Transcript_12789/g.38588 Transcript_12789/m.38588 type:complete len:263 (-) Transcript_12789:241-1029(-)